MTTAVRDLIQRFEQLDSEEKKEAAREILSRIVPSESLSVSDEELTALADDLFLEIDRQEASL